MIYVTGDTHAIEEKWINEIEPHLKKDDLLIVAGDFGMGFWNGKHYSEELFFDHIESRDFILCFVDGNHENFDKLYSYPIEEWNGGKVHKIRNNLFHLMRGEIYHIEGNIIFTMGGGYSLDKWMRKPGVSWWKEEMPSKEEYEHALKNLEKAGNKVDYIITHTASLNTLEYFRSRSFLGIKANVIEERELNFFLKIIEESTEYKRWYFGHFHVDEEIDMFKQTALLNTIRELTTGRIIHSWIPYE